MFGAPVSLRNLENNLASPFSISSSLFDIFDLISSKLYLRSAKSPSFFAWVLFLSPVHSQKCSRFSLFGADLYGKAYFSLHKEGNQKEDRNWNWPTICSPSCTPFCVNEWAPFANFQKHYPVTKLSLKACLPKDKASF